MIEYKKPELQMETIQKNGMRFYCTPHGDMPSITTVLSKTQSSEKQESLQRWRDGVGAERANEIVQLACENGTELHTLAELFLKKEQMQFQNFNEKALKSFNSLKIMLKKIQDCTAQEQAVYSKELGVAGRFDLIGTYKNKLSIIDFKTSSKIKTLKDIDDYCLQLCFYASAYNEMNGTDISQGVILMVADASIPQEFIIDMTDYFPELKNRVHKFFLNTRND